MTGNRSKGLCLFSHFSKRIIKHDYRVHPSGGVVNMAGMCMWCGLKYLNEVQRDSTSYFNSLTIAE